VDLVPVQNKPCADLVYLPHPLTGKCREFHRTVIVPGETLSDYISRQSVINVDEPVIFVNGDLVFSDQWEKVLLHDGDLITVRPRLQGGDMSSDQAKVVRTVLTIAILIYTNGMGAEGALLAVAGIAVINELVPFPEPEEEETNPNYSVGKPGNRARPFSPMLLTMGVHRVYPDLGSATYTEFYGDDQYLNSVFHFGIGDLILSDFKIGDTLLTDFDDYEIEESGADGKLTLFPANVDTQAGGTLDNAAGWITRTSSLDATALVFDLTGYLYQSDEGVLIEHQATIQIQYREVGSIPWLTFGESVDGQYILKHSSRELMRWSRRQVVTQGQYEIRAQRVSADDTNSAKVSNLLWSQLKTFQPDIKDYSGQKRVALRVKAGGQFNGQIGFFNAMVSAQVPVFSDPDWITQDSTNPGFILLALTRGIFINGNLAAGAGLPDNKIDIEGLKNFASWCDSANLSCSLIFDQKLNCLDMLNTVARCGRGSITWCNGILGVVWDAPSLPVTTIFGMSNIRRNTFKVNYSTGPVPDNVALSFINPDTGYQEDEVKVSVSNGSGDGRELSVKLKGCTSAIQAGREANLLAASFQYRRRQIVFESDMEGAVVQRGDVVQLSHDLTNWDDSGRLKSGSNTVFVLDHKVEFKSGYQHYFGLRYPDGRHDIYDVNFFSGSTDTITLSTPIIKSEWLSSMAVVSGDEIEPTVFNGLYFTAQNSGTTGITEPVWPTSLGESVVDNNVTWTASGEAREFIPDDDLDSDGPVDYIWFFGASNSPGKRAKVIDILPVSDHSLKLTLIDDEPGYYSTEYNDYAHTIVNNPDLAPRITDFDIKDTLSKAGAGHGLVIAMSWETSGDYGGAIVRAAPDGEDLKIINSTNNRSIQFPWPATIGTLVVEVVLMDKLGIPNISSKITHSHEIVGANLPISDVTGFSSTLNDFEIVLSWNELPDAHLYDYEIRMTTGLIVPTVADWDTATPVTRLMGVTHNVPIKSADTYHFMIRARDTDRRQLSADIALTTLVINPPSQPNVSSIIEGENVILSWSASSGDFALSGYKVYYGDVFGSAIQITEIDATRHTLKANWTDNRRFWIEPVDVAGNAGTAGSVDVTINQGTLTNLTAQVIDNNVLLKWTSSPGTLPIVEFEFRKGDLFASAETLGVLKGTFFSHFEDQSGQYRYWLVPIDSAGNYGTEQSVLANVDEPPDFILHQEWISDFSGTKTNIFQMQNGLLILPVNTTETFAQHFTNNAWTTPQNQIDAGYPFYLEPSTNSAVYEQEYDYGTDLSGTLITLLLDSTVLDGSVTVTPQISVKQLAGDAWTDYPGVWQQYALNFRYVKIRLDFAAAGGDDQLQINAIKTRLAVKQKTDAGSGTAISTDSGGTLVSFNKAFLDVQSIIVTPKGTTARTGIYDFTDTPNPTDFRVYLFDQNGTRVSGDFSWSAEGF